MRIIKVIINKSTVFLLYMCHNNYPPFSAYFLECYYKNCIIIVSTKSTLTLPNFAYSSLLAYYSADVDF